MKCVINEDAISEVASEIKAVRFARVLIRPNKDFLAIAIVAKNI